MTDEASLVDTAIVAAAMGANPRALTMVKQLITDNMAEADLSSVQAREMVALNQCYESAEHHEAINAFRGREPDFKAARAEASAGDRAIASCSLPMPRLGKLIFEDFGSPQMRSLFRKHRPVGKRPLHIFFELPDGSSITPRGTWTAFRICDQQFLISTLR